MNIWLIVVVIVVIVVMIFGPKIGEKIKGLSDNLKTINENVNNLKNCFKSE